MVVSSRAALAKGVHGVGEELVLAALMGDVQRRVLLDQRIGGMGGHGKRAEENGMTSTPPRTAAKLSAAGERLARGRKIGM